MARIVGTSGNDVLRGTSHRDVIIGRGGKDKIIGKGGNDVIKGGDGKDTLIGGNGNDTIKGGSGKDLIKGNNGNDNLYGNSGADKLIGAKGADDLWGGGGGDAFKFNAGDGLHAQFPNDPVLPNTFDDVVHDFKGMLQGGTDKFDTPNTIDVSGDSFDGAFYIFYGNGVFAFDNPVGSFFVSNVNELSIGDFI